MEQIFDRKLLVARKTRAWLNPVPGSDFLMQRACEDLRDRLSVVGRKFEHAVTLFSGAKAAEAILQTGKADKVTRVEVDAVLLGDGPGLVQADEILPPDILDVDLIVSLYALHEINDVPGLLAQARRALKPDGLFLAAFAGSGTLNELRECLLTAESEISGGASARIHPFMDVRDAGALLQRAGFALPVADVETVTVRYDNAIGLMHDLRAMGATNALSDRPPRKLTRAVLLRTAEIYANRFADADGRCRATFDTLWISGWAPHESQQKPLQPGSARTSLSKALSEIENGGSPE